MHYLPVHVMLLAASASGKSFHIGPWIVVPLLFILALIGTPIFILRDRRKRRSAGPVK